MIEHDFPDDFLPIAAELQRLPYLSPRGDFADRVIASVDRLQPSRAAAPISVSGHPELSRGRRHAVTPRRRIGVVRGTVNAAVGVGLVAAAAFMFFEIDVLTSILSAASARYAFAIAALGAQAGALVLGPETIVYLQTGALEAILLYAALAIGLFGGYAAIRTAADVARRRAA